MSTGCDISVSDLGNPINQITHGVYRAVQTVSHAAVLAKPEMTSTFSYRLTLAGWPVLKDMLFSRSLLSEWSDSVLVCSVSGRIAF